MQFHPAAALVPCLPAVALSFAVASPSGADEEADFSAVRDYLNQSVEEGSVAGGAVLVIARGEVVLETGFGYADIRSKRPFLADTPAVIASISKPVLGTALFHLAQEGRFDPTLPISEYLPEFANRKLASGSKIPRAPNTVELLTHTSGIRNDTAPGGRPWFASWTKAQRLADVVRRYASEFPFESLPGTRHAYSGIGTDVAAEVAEVVSMKPRNEFLIETLCEPLGMDHTYYRASGQARRVSPMPTRYYRGDDGKLLVSKPRALPPPNTYSSSGGSIISTAQDLSRWLLMIRGGGTLRDADPPYLTSETIETLLRPNKIGPHVQGGFFIRQKDGKGQPVVIGHSGSSGTDCWINFKTDTIGILLTQTRGKDIEPFRLGLYRRITDQIAQAPTSANE